MPEGSPEFLLAFVLLESAALPDFTALRASPWASRHEISWDEPKDGIALFTLDGAEAHIALMPAPVPWSDLELPCAASRFWREATDVCRKHQAHLVVALRSAEPDPVTRHLLLTEFVAALLEATPAALAVYWGNGGVVQSTEIFREFSAAATPNDLPLYLWVDFRLWRQEAGGLYIATTGLEPFGVMELEGTTRRLDPQTLMGKVYDLAHYVCQNGPVLADGDTIGESATERIRIRHAPSVWQRGQVVRIDFDGPERKGPGKLIQGLFGRGN
ncbi:MAG TPA: DUF4261 domain-containing protein [Symbiobacteriaceae bacterium]|nr:DUF4261 domain-containing protein [Symbiobacteriaceae bacterium]